MSAAGIAAPPGAPLYQANWPRSLDPERAPWQAMALAICVFALQIIFLPFYMGYCVLQKIAAHALLPSAYLTLIEGRAEQQRRRQMANETIVHINAPASRSTAKRCSFKTPDAVRLDGLLVKSRQASLTSHKVVVFCCQNDACYEQMLRPILTQLRGPDMVPQQVLLPNLPALFQQPPAPRPQQSRGRGSHIQTLSSSSRRGAQAQPQRSNIRTLSDIRHEERHEAEQAIGQLDQVFEQFSRVLNGAVRTLNSVAEQAENQHFSPGFSEVPDFSFMQQDFLNPDISVFFLNYRGVGDSQGIGSTNTLPLDVYSAYKYLIAREGFAAHNIAFYGASMGGVAGPCGAELVQEEYPQAELGGLSLVAPSSLSAAAKNLVGRKCCGILGTLSGWAVSLLDVDLDAAAAWRRLRGRKAAVNNGGDPIIAREASLAYAVGANGGGAIIAGGFGHGIQADNRRGLPELRQTLGLPAP